MGKAGLQRSPTKNVIIVKKVTVSGWGVDPMYTYRGAGPRKLMAGTKKNRFGRFFFVQSGDFQVPCSFFRGSRYSN